MDVVTERLQELTALVHSARSLPMSASCVLNRPEVLTRLADLTALLPASLDRAREVLDDQALVVAQGRTEATRLIAEAMAERLVLLSDAAVLVAAEAEAARVLDQARSTAAAMRLEVEDYVDGKLATFEVVLGKTLAAVERGRSKLAGAHELDALRDVEDDLDGPPLPG